MIRASAPYVYYKNERYINALTFTFLFCGHMMPPLLNLSNIRCKSFSYGRCHGKQKDAVKERTNEGVYVGCWKILYNGPIDKKIAVKFLIHLYETCK